MESRVIDEPSSSRLLLAVQSQFPSGASRLPPPCRSRPLTRFVVVGVNHSWPFRLPSRPCRGRSAIRTTCLRLLTVVWIVLVLSSCRELQAIAAWAARRECGPPPSMAAALGGAVGFLARINSTAIPIAASDGEKQSARRRSRAD